MHLQKIFILALTGLLFVPISAFGQVSINYDNCQYEIIHQNVYVPFYFHINHQPATGQIFKQKVDPSNIVPFHRAPEGVPEGQATWFEMGSIANATATYEFELELEYTEPSENPRPITMQLFSANNLMMEKKINQIKDIGCIAFRVHVTPQPHQFTSEEILQIAEKEFIGITKQYTDSVNRNTEETQGLKTAIFGGLVGLVVTIIFLVIYVHQQKTQRDAEKDEMEVRTSMLATAITKVDAQNKMLKLNDVLRNAENSKLISDMGNAFGSKLQEMSEFLTKFKNVITTTINEVRDKQGLEPVTMAEEPPLVTFADAEKVGTLQTEPKIAKEQSSEEGKEKLFGFDLGFLTKKIKPPKKEQPKDLKQEWEKMSNTKLLALYDDFTGKATYDMDQGRGQTENYHNAVAILDILNKRHADLEGDKEQ